METKLTNRMMPTKLTREVVTKRGGSVLEGKPETKETKPAPKTDTAADETKAEK